MPSLSFLGLTDGSCAAHTMRLRNNPRKLSVSHDRPSGHKTADRAPDWLQAQQSPLGRCPSKQWPKATSPSEFLESIENVLTVCWFPPPAPRPTANTAAAGIPASGALSNNPRYALATLRTGPSPGATMTEHPGSRRRGGPHENIHFALTMQHNPFWRWWPSIQGRN